MEKWSVVPDIVLQINMEKWLARRLEEMRLEPKVAMLFVVLDSAQKINTGKYGAPCNPEGVLSKTRPEMWSVLADANEVLRSFVRFLTSKYGLAISTANCLFGLVG